jgi:hypothetical protein
LAAVKERSNLMNNDSNIDQAEQEAIDLYEVSDEALEAAADMEAGLIGTHRTCSACMQCTY